MRRTLFTIIIALLGVTGAWAQTTFTVNNLKYRITDTSALTVEVIGYAEHFTGTLDIPATVSYVGTDYTVTSIGNSAFEYCSGIRQLNLPATVVNINSWAFDNCAGIEQINVAEGNTAYSSENGVLFNKDKSILVIYPAAREGESYTVPDGVTAIDANAFKRCSKLTEVKLPKSLTNIYSNAFTWCVLLEQITIPDGVGIIGNSAFMYCSNLSRVTIGSGVSDIGSFAFSNCSSLSEMTVMAVVPPTVASSTFDGVSRDIPLYVLKESLSAYQTAEVWKEFTKLQALSTTGLQTPSMPESISIQGGMLHNPQQLPVIIYDLTGRLVYSGNATTVELPAGIYVVSCNGASCKAVF